VVAVASERAVELIRRCNSREAVLLAELAEVREIRISAAAGMAFHTMEVSEAAGGA
jgi:hypothetical protein